MSKTGRMTVTASRGEADLVSHITGNAFARFAETSATRGGACRDRTDDLKLAKLALSQLS
jgi:hypothetical protein